MESTPLGNLLIRDAFLIVVRCTSQRRKGIPFRWWCRGTTGGTTGDGLWHARRTNCLLQERFIAAVSSGRAVSTDTGLSAEQRLFPKTENCIASRLTFFCSATRRHAMVRHAHLTRVITTPIPPPAPFPVAHSHYALQVGGVDVTCLGYCAFGLLPVGVQQGPALGGSRYPLTSCVSFPPMSVL